MATPTERNRLLELLHHNHYSPKELASVLGMDVHLILHDAQSGQLKAYIVDHQVIDICREDVIDWLRQRSLR